MGFVPETAKAPTLIDDALPGMLAAAWLEVPQVGDRQRLLLGYIQIAGPHPGSPALRIYGVSADAVAGRGYIPPALPVDCQPVAPQAVPSGGSTA